MKTARTRGLSAGWTLVLAGAVLIGMGPTAQADAPTAPAQKAQGNFFPQAATVKIDSAMLQERTIGADGSVHTETYLDALPTQSAKASSSVAFQTPVTTKA